MDMDIRRTGALTDRKRILESRPDAGDKQEVA
jgi:hypothetical protein